MLAQEVIARKRDGQRLSRKQIEFFVDGFTKGTIGEGQMAAFAMAVFFRGMDLDERVALTKAMMESGAQLDWSSLSEHGPIVDKHSTGGVGDKVSLMLAPIMAAAGAVVPMISGRGLGHTGGTLDKLDAIPGYRSQPDIALLQRVVRACGCAIIGQTADLAPADRRLYAVRDVTATVESLDLITASILSKKLAAGLHYLVLDVKTGRGAFAASLGEARQLGESLVTVANGAGLPTRALITNMNHVLGTTAGNAVEVKEAVDYLTGAGREARLHAVVHALAVEMLTLSGLAGSDAEAGRTIDRVLAQGHAAERFQQMVHGLGGAADFVEQCTTYLPQAPVQIPVFPEASQRLVGLDTRAVGMTIVEMGGGRKATEGSVDHRVGFTHFQPPGAVVGPENPLAMVHARDQDQADAAAVALLAAADFAEPTSSPPAEELVYARLLPE